MWKNCFIRDWFSSFFLSYDHCREPPSLGKHEDSDIVLKLPMGKRIRDIRWLSVWCRRFTVSLRSIYDSWKKRLLVVMFEIMAIRLWYSKTDGMLEFGFLVTFIQQSLKCNWRIWSQRVYRVGNTLSDSNKTLWCKYFIHSSDFISLFLNQVDQTV